MQGRPFCCCTIKKISWFAISCVFALASCLAVLAKEFAWKIARITLQLSAVTTVMC